jgi:hypothetical protein
MLQDDDKNQNDSFLTLLTVVIVLISMLYLLGAFQLFQRLIRRHCGGGEDDTGEETVLVHEGRVFTLNGHQRRAVLEAIFPETVRCVFWLVAMICAFCRCSCSLTHASAIFSF